MPDVFLPCLNKGDDDDDDDDDCLRSKVEMKMDSKVWSSNPGECKIAKKKQTGGSGLGIGLEIGGSIGLGIGGSIGIGPGQVMSMLFLLRNTPSPPPPEKKTN